MVGTVFALLVVVSVGFSLLSGNAPALGEAVFSGAERAVSLSISLLGTQCLFCGILEVLQKAGATDRLSRLLSPFLSFAFPHAAKTGVGREEISASVAANLLGIGNAAAPFALEAFRKMQKDNPDKERATDDMVTLAVLNCSSFSLIPATLLSLRRAAGSQNPASVVLPILFCGLLSVLLSVVLCRLFCLAGRRRAERLSG